MAGTSAIEWTDCTWNPIVGCSIVSPGCTNCYAMKMAARILAMAGTSTTGLHYDKTIKDVKGTPVWTGVVNQAPEATLLAPLRWKKPRRIFVNSMGDLFHESIPDEWIDRVFAVMALSPQHTFQVLTKRAERMRRYLGSIWSEMTADGWMGEPPRRFDKLCAELGKSPWSLGDGSWPLRNVWLGVSAERQEEANERIPHLLRTPAAIRFVSAEPLLGSLSLMGVRSGDRVYDALQGCWARQDGGELEHGGSCQRLHWVIVGGESGPHARRMHDRWARDLRDECDVNGVPFFFKQWGQHDPETHDRVGKKAAGRLLDGRTHDDCPQVPA
jgi:protein gp37